jgi:hypothetical protein
MTVLAKYRNLSHTIPSFATAFNAVTQLYLQQFEMIEKE